MAHFSSAQLESLVGWMVMLAIDDMKGAQRRGGQDVRRGDRRDD